MTIKIIGAGMGRTVTLSLKTALEELGFNKCYHTIELFYSVSLISGVQLIIYCVNI